MTADQPGSDGESFDRETFKIELAELVDHACETDTTIRGGYRVETPQPNQPDYNIEITRVLNAD